MPRDAPAQRGFTRKGGEKGTAFFVFVICLNLGTFRPKDFRSCRDTSLSLHNRTLRAPLPVNGRPRDSNNSINGTSKGVGEFTRLKIVIPGDTAATNSFT